MQSVAPAAAFHDTSSLLVNNLHLAVHDNILVVLVEHSVCLEELLQRVHALTLYAIVCQQLILLVDTLLVCQSGLVLKSRELACYIGQHEKVLVVNLSGEPFCTLVGKVARFQFLVNDKVQWLNSLRHPAVVVLHVNLLSLEHTSLDTLFREIFDERLVLGQALVRTVQGEEALVE